MNVSFHVLTGIAAAAILAPRTPPVRRTMLLGGVGTAIAMHGLLDYAPHTYPIRSAIDVPLGLVLFGAALLLARPAIRGLLTICFVGSILPDLIDLGPGILSRHAGLHLPQFHWFPWHWRQYSGSLYTGATAGSVMLHVVVLTVTMSAIWYRWDRLSAERIAGSDRRPGTTRREAHET